MAELQRKPGQGLVGLLVVFLFGGTTLTMAQNYEILRADPDGANLELVLSRDNALARGSIAFDPDGGRTPMYYAGIEPWSEGGALIRSTIRRAGYDGEFNIPTVAYGGGPVAIDPLHDKVYYTYSSDYIPSSRIARADLDGSNSGVLDGLVWEYSIGGLVVDPSGGKIYWSGETFDTDGISYLYGVWVADLDGSQAEQLIDTEPHTPGSLAIDTSAGKLYWIEGYSEGKIRSANIDGSGVEDLIPNLSRPRALAIDPDGGWIWWSEWSSESGHVILRAHLDGSGATPLIGSLTEPVSLAYVQQAGTNGEKLYIVANPGPVDIPVPAVSGAGALVLVVLLSLAAWVLLSRRRAFSGKRA